MIQRNNKNKKIAAICSELFHEEPLAKDLREIADRMDTEKTGKTLVQTYEAKKSAQSRIYGLSKAKQAIAKITGKWSRYMMLMEKEELTEKEQEEITTMFR